MKLAIRRFAACLLASTAFSSSSSHALAQEKDEVHATKLFEEGRRLARDGHCAEAIPILRESVRQAEGIGAHLNLGHCQQTLGKTATAYRHFKRAQELAESRGDARKTEASERASALAGSLSTLTVRGADALEQGLELRLDDERLDAARWGRPIFVDPGTHAIEVVSSRRGRSVLSVVVRGEGDRASVLVPPWSEVNGDRARAGSGSESSGHQRTVGYVVGGVGVAGVAVGTIFGILSLSKHQSVLDRCPTYPTCDASARPAVEDSNSSASAMGNVATVGFIAGAALLVTGIALLVTTPRRPAATATR